MVNKSFELVVDGKSYSVEVVRPGVISVDGNVYNVETTDKGVTVDGESYAGSLSDGFAIVGGKLYETEWKTK